MLDIEDDDSVALSLYELLAVRDDKESTSLGRFWLPTAMSLAEAQKLLTTRYWDDRLDAAGYVPYTRRLFSD